MNLDPFVNTLQVLNYSKEASTINHIYKLLGIVDNNSYIISNADHEILIMIEFNRNVHIDTINIHALPLQLNSDHYNKMNLSEPKLINIYKTNNVSINFNDISSIKPNITTKCEIKKLNNINGESIHCKPKITFNSVKYLIIYIKSNQNDTEYTYLNGITIKGTVKQQQLDIDAFNPSIYWNKEMKNKKDIDKKNDFHQSRIAQNHLKIIFQRYFHCVNYKNIKIDNKFMTPLITNNSNKYNSNLFTKVTYKTDRGKRILNIFLKSGIIQKILFESKYKYKVTCTDIIEETKDIHIGANRFRRGLCKYTGSVKKATATIYLYFGESNDMDILSTLIHELAHTQSLQHGHDVIFCKQQAKIAHFVYDNIKKKQTFYKKENKILTLLGYTSNINNRKRSFQNMLSDDVFRESQFNNNNKPKEPQTKRIKLSPNKDLKISIDCKPKLLVNKTHPDSDNNRSRSRIKETRIYRKQNPLNIPKVNVKKIVKNNDLKLDSEKKTYAPKLMNSKTYNQCKNTNRDVTVTTNTPRRSPRNRQLAHSRNTNYNRHSTFVHKQPSAHQQFPSSTMHIQTTNNNNNNNHIQQIRDRSRQTYQQQRKRYNRYYTNNYVTRRETPKLNRNTDNIYINQYINRNSSPIWSQQHNILNKQQQKQQINRNDILNNRIQTQQHNIIIEMVHHQQQQRQKKNRNNILNTHTVNSQPTQQHNKINGNNPYLLDQFHLDQQLSTSNSIKHSQSFLEWGFVTIGLFVLMYFVYLTVQEFTS